MLHDNSCEGYYIIDVSFVSVRICSVTLMCICNVVFSQTGLSRVKNAHENVFLHSGESPIILTYLLYTHKKHYFTYLFA